jgi:hypothetical protein
MADVPVFSAQGILWVGDPHLSSVPPARRLDDYTQTALDKLHAAVCLAHARHCVLLIGGDLFTRARDFGQGLLTRTLRVLRSRPVPILCLPGNHDIAQMRLTDDTSLACLEAAGALQVIGSSVDQDAALAAQPGLLSSRLVAAPSISAVITLPGQTKPALAIGGTPYGQPIPQDVRPLLEQANLPPDCPVVWLTHADLDFATGRGLPGMPAPPEILGAVLAINGHQHATQPPRQVGSTRWFNPGNVTRQSVDLRDHVPSVWEWSAQAIARGDLTPQQHVLPHAPGASVFDLTGTHLRADGFEQNAQRLMEAATQILEREGVDVARPRQISDFVRDLAEQQGTETRLTADGALLRAQAQSFFEQDRTPPAVQSLFFDLLSSCAAARQKPHVEPK